MTTAIPFWSNDLTILMNKNNILELWPNPKMNFEQKLNAISRLVIILTILGFIFTMSVKIIFIGIITLFVIFLLYNYRNNKVTKEMFQNENNNAPDSNKQDNKNNLKKMTKEAVNNMSSKNEKIINPQTLEELIKSDFQENTKINPFSNVLLTDIADNPNRKAAPPAFNPEIYEDITNSTKKMVQKLNPEIKNTNKQLFGDLGEKFYLDQSNRIFYSTANTRVTNDQTAFANYLYGLMPSSKEANVLGAVERVKDSYRYTLY